MALKLMFIILLSIAAIHAAPASEDDDLEEIDASRVLDPKEDELEAVDEDEGDDELEDEEDSTPSEDGKNKYKQMFGYHQYCVCKRKSAKGDEPMSDEEFEDQVAQLDPAKKRKSKFNAYINKLIKPFFKKTDLYCFCTRNKAVVRLMRYLNMAAIVAHKQKIAFAKRVKLYIVSIKKQRSG